MTDKNTRQSSHLLDYLIKQISVDLPNYSPIQCQLYDYIEIACMRRYQLDIEIKSGDTIRGRAKQTLIKEKQEFLVIEFDTEEVIQKNDTQDTELEIRLDLIKSITTLDKNADFKTVEIN